MVKEKFQQEAESADDLLLMADRISQIRLFFCKGNNRIFSQKTGIDEATSAKICSGTRGAGAKMLEKIVLAFPDIDARWLLTGIGKMLDGNIKSSYNEPVEAVLQIRLSKDKKDQVMKLVFGENNIEILNK